MRRLAGVCAVIATLIAAPVALAHQGNPNYRSVVGSISPAIDGLTVSVINFDDALLMQNTSGRDITILDYQTPPKPYAQLLADGTVRVNTNSEAYYLNEDRLGEGAVPKDLGADPAWKVLSKSSRFEWHDHRAHWMGASDPPGLKDKDVRTKIMDWTVPMEVGGTPTRITGTLTWVPLEGGGLPLGAILAFAALLIVLALAVFIIRRRRDPDGGASGEVAPREPVEAW